MALGADWSARPIAGSTIAAFRASYEYTVTDNAGSRTYVDVQNLSFVLRYANFTGQGLSYLTAEEYAAHKAAGIHCFLIFQKTTRDPDGGYAKGQQFGVEAVAYAEKIGYDNGDVIFFTADAPIGSYNLTTAGEFFRGATEVVRASGFLGGVYGFKDVIWWCQDRSIGDVYWMCGSESGMRPGIHLYQWNNGRIYPGGVDSDLVKQFELIPTKDGDDDVSADDVWFKKVIGPDGTEQGYNFNDATYWTNVFVNDLRFTLVPALQAQTAAMAKLLGDATTNPDINPEEIRKAFDAALKSVLDGFLTQLRGVVVAAVGADNTKLVDEILDTMAIRLHTAGPVNPGNGV